MDYDRRAVTVEQWCGSFGQPRIGYGDFQMALAIGADDQIGQIAHMRASRSVRSMNLAGGVPVRTCAGEGKRLARANGVNMEAMHARRQASRMDHQLQTRSSLAYRHRSQRRAARIEQCRPRRGWRNCGSGFSAIHSASRRRQRRDEDERRWCDGSA